MWINRNSLSFRNQEIEITNRRALDPFRLHFNGSPLPPGLDRPIAPLPRRENWESRAMRGALHVRSQAEKNGLPGR